VTVIRARLWWRASPLRQREVRGWLGQRPPQPAELDRAGDDLEMALWRVDRPLVPVVQLCVEERRRLAALRALGGVVGDRGGDPAQQEAGLVRAQVDVGALAVGVGGGRLAEHPRQPLIPRPIHEEALGPREHVLAASGGHRYRLARVGDGVPGGRQAHALVAEQLSLGGLGDA
jgi:hypothetical protein